MNFSSLKLILRWYGPQWILYRLGKSVGSRLGYLKFRIPSQPWENFGQKQFSCTVPNDGADFLATRKKMGVRFLFSDKARAGNQPGRYDSDSTWARIHQNRVLDGEYLYFSSRWIRHGDQPDWFLNPYTKQHAPNDGHFSKINEFGYGDVKAVWELSRFGVVFDLVRAYSRTKDPKCVEEFWRLVEDWIDKNPPFDGINWKCGQESSFRMLAVIFGFWAFAGHEMTNSSRVTKIYWMVQATALRVERHIGYAISQKNNHGISEAVYLWTVGTLFPELKNASRWQQLGQKVLAQLCGELIYEDGGFSQFSANYHRLVLHLLAWTTRLAQQNDIELSSPILDRYQRLHDCMSSMIDPTNGLVPRYGNDDGAHLFPLSHCEYNDYRPVIQLGEKILKNQLAFEPGVWDEALYWFGLDPAGEGNEPSTLESQDEVISFPEAGCHILKMGKNRIFVRAGEFKHRPGQLDATHVDIWWKGFDVATDPGIYSYNGDGIWKTMPFYRSAAHNTVTVDGQEPAKRLSQFMFLPWHESKVCETVSKPNIVAGEFSRQLDFEISPPVSHRRIVALLPDGVFLVIDRLRSTGTHDYRLNWLLNCTNVVQGSELLDLTLRSGEHFFGSIHSDAKSDLNIINATDGSPAAWLAPKYLELQAAVATQMEIHQAENCNLVSIFSPTSELVSQWSSVVPAILKQDGFEPTVLAIEQAFS